MREALERRGGIRQPTDADSVQLLFAPVPTVGGNEDRDGVAAPRQRSREAGDERTRDVAGPTGVGVRDESDAHPISRDA